MVPGLAPPYPAGDAQSEVELLLLFDELSDLLPEESEDEDEDEDEESEDDEPESDEDELEDESLDDSFLAEAAACFCLFPVRVP